MRALRIFLKARVFTFLRKLSMFLLISVFAKLYGVTLKPIHVLQFLVFMLAYLSVYIFNDIVDYEFDKRRKVIRTSKILARGLVDVRDYALLGFFFLSLSALLAPFLLARDQQILFYFLVLFAYVRSFFRSLFARTASIFLLEFLNLELFSSFFNLEKELLLPVIIGSAFYSIYYFIYRAKEKDPRLMRLYVPSNLLLLLGVIFLPFQSAIKLYLTLALILLAVGWYRSMISGRSWDMVPFALAFVLVSLLFLFFSSL